MDTSTFQFISLKRGSRGHWGTYDGLAIGKTQSFSLSSIFMERVGMPTTVAIDVDAEKKAIRVTANPTDATLTRKITHNGSTQSGTVSGASIAKKLGLPEGRYHYVSNDGPDTFICLHDSVELHS